MGLNRILVALLLVGSASFAACATEDRADWAEGACDDFSAEVPGASGLGAPAEPTTVGEIKEVLSDTGGETPTEWDDLSDDDSIADCLYDLDAVCPDGEPSSSSADRQVRFWVDESGRGVEYGTLGPALTDC